MEAEQQPKAVLKKDSEKCVTDCAREGKCYLAKAHQAYQKYNREVLDGPAIFTKFSPAVVSVTSTTTLNIGEGIEVTAQGAGFFVKGFYIVTAARNLLLPQIAGPIREPPSNPGTLVRAVNLYVTVYNAGGCGRNVIYEADLCGVDGAGDIAVLRIDPLRLYNRWKPDIERCHNYLNWGCSRAYIQGAKTHFIGFDGDSTQPIFTTGVVAANRYDGPVGFLLESVLTTNEYFSTSVGSPILDDQGKVIGIYTNINNNLSGGPSQYIAERVVCAIIRGPGCNNSNPHLEIQLDPVGNFFRYIKGFLGVTYSAPRTLDLIGTDLDHLTGWLVENLDPDSPLLNIVVPGDIITRINKRCLGAIAPQEAITNLTWFLLPGRTVRIYFRSASEGYSTEFFIDVELIDYPLDLDLPDSQFARNIGKLNIPRVVKEDKLIEGVEGVEGETKKPEIKRKPTRVEKKSGKPGKKDKRELKISKSPAIIVEEKKITPKRVFSKSINMTTAKEEFKSILTKMNDPKLSVDPVSNE